jgi:DNA-binding transcriptional LysR family regulator
VLPPWRKGRRNKREEAGMNVNLKLLQTFLLVAKHNSFRRAAEESNRSQSAVSMQIRQLEQQLGVSLFHRTTRRVQLTREGELLLDCARKAVLEMQIGLRQIKEAVDIQRGRLSLACTPTVAFTQLPQILSLFQKGYPSVTAHVRELTSTDMLDHIRRHDVDFGIGARVPDAAGFHFHPILVDEIYALIPADIDLGQCDGVSLAALSRIPTLMIAGSSVLRAMLNDAQKTAGVTLNITFEVGQVQTQIAMAAAGLGAAILPRIAIPEAPDPRLRAVPIVDPPLARELCVITLPGQSLPPIAARFVEILQRVIGGRQPTEETAVAAAPLLVPAPNSLRRSHLALTAGAPT